MSDYAAAATQPILQGLLTISSVAGVRSATFFGRGVSAVSAGAAPGQYTLTLDPGLPGNNGYVEQTPVGLAGPLAPDPRTFASLRNTGAAAQAQTGITVSYGGLVANKGYSTITLTVVPSFGGAPDNDNGFVLEIETLLGVDSAVL